MYKENTILALDIGGGTQDILLYDPNKTVENCFKFVLPSPTVLIKEKVQSATAAKRDIHLTGDIMGGGPCKAAVKKHIQAGLSVTSTPQAAKTFFDDIKRVEQMGIVICENPKSNALEIELKDLELPSLMTVFDTYNIAHPQTVAVAVQDHGEAIGQSNRVVRSQNWRTFIEAGGNPLDLIYTDVPDHLTRMLAVKRAYPDALLMDTGPAAILGALCDPKVASKQDQGIVVVNIGNMHTLAFLLKNNRVFGMFEHHTSMLSPIKLAQLVSKLQKGAITQEEIYNDGGHGGSVSDAATNMTFDFITVTGPNRHLAHKLNCHPAVPHGDMMLSGCFGLVSAVHALPS
ncbi:uncharacterized protein (DUF1786 family) [Desulfitispora alkaliphila]|uniref:DUF1786 domain-containing protein n=1 Tax=Desulfitispora alkaliphila TaxID=622674 RepID=UPI003D1AEB40